MQGFQYFSSESVLQYLQWVQSIKILNFHEYLMMCLNTILKR
jgi:hypothetical protein